LRSSAASDDGRQQSFRLVLAEVGPVAILSAANGDRQTNVTTNTRPIPNWLRSPATVNGNR
jgi:hypothetical protein